MVRTNCESVAAYLWGRGCATLRSELARLTYRNAMTSTAPTTRAISAAWSLLQRSARLLTSLDTDRFAGMPGRPVEEASLI